MKKTSKQLTVRDAIAFGIEKLTSSGSPSPRLDTLILLEKTLDVSRAWLLSNGESPLLDAQRDQFLLLLSKREQFVPIAYLLGEKEFYGRPFKVTSAVLVPRAETEDLIALALAIRAENLTLLDLGTGSGCIGITLAHERPDWTISLSDNSQAALDIAKLNVANHRLTNKISLHKEDLLVSQAVCYDLVMANLPYVPLRKKASPTIQHEPPGALFSGLDGIDHYRRLISILNTSPLLKPKNIITESLPAQHNLLQELFAEVGYQLVTTKGLGQHFVLNTTV